VCETSTGAKTVVVNHPPSAAGEGTMDATGSSARKTSNDGIQARPDTMCEMEMDSSRAPVTPVPTSGHGTRANLCDLMPWGALVSRGSTDRGYLNRTSRAVGGGSSSQDGNPDDQLDPDNQADDSLELDRLYHQCPGYN